MTNEESIKTAVETIGGLAKAFASLKAENTALRNQLQDIRVALNVEPTAVIKALKFHQKAREATPAVTPKPKTTTKRGRKFLFSDAQVLAIREQHNKGASVLALAKEHKVSPPTIYNALTRGLSTPIKASTNGAGAGKH